MVRVQRHEDDTLQRGGLGRDILQRERARD